MKKITNGSKNTQLLREVASVKGKGRSKRKIDKAYWDSSAGPQDLETIIRTLDMIEGGVTFRISK